MNWGQIGAQLLAIIRLEMSKTFLAKRGLWVYLLALAPVVIYVGHSWVELSRWREFEDLARAKPVKSEALQSIENGMTEDEVIAILGEPHKQLRSPGRRTPVSDLQYTDGERLLRIVLVNGEVVAVNTRRRDSVSSDSLVFATVFQFFYLRLAVFFGCVGVFTNLFRGELLDKSLHYYLLAPIRREVLAIGKYLSGLIATVTIFTLSTALQLTALFWHLDRTEVATYLAGPGWGHVAQYLGVTVAACIGYGSVFLTAGLLLRNPIIPAALVLMWEGANLFLPAALKKFSVIYYLQSLCPIVAQPDQNLPPVLKLLINAAEPASAPVAIIGLLTVSTLILVFAAYRARKLEINYGTE